MKVDFTREELELLEEILEAIEDGFEYFTEENVGLYESICYKVVHGQYE